MKDGRDWRWYVMCVKRRVVSGLPPPAVCTNCLCVWVYITQHYRVSWPLHLIMTQPSLVHYNDLFRYLLLIKRVGLALQRRYVCGAWGERGCKRFECSLFSRAAGANSWSLNEATS